MKMKKTLLLFLFPVLMLAFVDFMGCSLTGGSSLPEHNTKKHPYQLAKTFQEQHDAYLEKAIEYYREALEDPETEGLARFKLGMLFYETGDFVSFRGRSCRTCLTNHGPI